jgi:hypothetical protein
LPHSSAAEHPVVLLLLLLCKCDEQFLLWNLPLQSGWLLCNCGEQFLRDEKHHTRTGA